MKKLFLASVALAAAFAIPQSALAGGVNGSDSNNAPAGAHFNSPANVSSHSDKKVPQGSGGQVGTWATLTTAPATESLLLLGAGLLSFASAVFILKRSRKSAAQ